MQFILRLIDDTSKFEDVHFNVDDGVISAVGGDSLWQFNYSDFSLRGATALQGPGRFLGLYGDALYAITGSDSTYRIEQHTPTSVAVEPALDIPDTYVIEQNYPNPFRSRTTIRLGMKEHAHVTLRIFNVMGQEVETLVDQLLPPGYHGYKWDGSTFSAGIYFAFMEVAGEYRSAIRLVSVK